MKYFTLAFVLIVLCAVLHQTTARSHEELKLENEQGSLLRERREVRYNCPFCSSVGGPTGPARCNNWCRSTGHMMGECVGIKCQCFNSEPDAV